jgi:hypothetical protein
MPLATFEEMKTPSNIVTRRRYKLVGQAPKRGWPIWIRMVADLLQNPGRFGSEYASETLDFNAQ